jgi:hypothetical protein
MARQTKKISSKEKVGSDSSSSSKTPKRKQITTSATQASSASKSKKNNKNVKPSKEQASSSISSMQAIDQQSNVPIPNQPSQLFPSSIPIPSFQRIDNLNFKSTPFSKLVIPGSKINYKPTAENNNDNLQKNTTEVETYQAPLTCDDTEDNSKADDSICPGMQNYYRLTDSENKKRKKKNKPKNHLKLNILHHYHRHHL